MAGQTPTMLLETSGCAAGGVLNVAGDLARRRALLLHRRRDRGSDVVDLAGGLADVPDGADRRRPDRQHAAGDGARISSVACAVWLALRASRNRRPRGRWYRSSRSRWPANRRSLRRRLADGACHYLDLVLTFVALAIFCAPAAVRRSELRPVARKICLPRTRSSARRTARRPKLVDRTGNVFAAIAIAGTLAEIGVTEGRWSTAGASTSQPLD